MPQAGSDFGPESFDFDLQDVLLACGNPRCIANGCKDRMSRFHLYNYADKNDTLYTFPFPT
jgi:hypothetical protein